MSTSGRFRIAYTALAAVLAASSAGAWGAFSSSFRCSGPPGSADPMRTATGFIETAVERDHPVRAYRLVTPAFRHGTSCREWASGKIPVKPFRHVDWNRAAYRIETRGEGQIVLRVDLASALNDRPPASFMLELRQSGKLWFVGFWDSTKA